MAIVTSMINHKGGVGKTTTALNLSRGLSLAGLRVLMIDIDPQANLTLCSGIEDPKVSIFNTFESKQPLPVIQISENLDLVPSDLRLEKAETMLITDFVNGAYRLDIALSKIKHDYDHVIIDCPPSMGLLTSNALLVSTGVIVVLQAHFLALKGIWDVMSKITEVKTRNPTLSTSGILITFAERTNVGQQVISEIQKAYGSMVYKTVIRKNVSVVESSSQGQALFDYSPSCNAALDYKAFTEEYLSKSKITV